MTCKIADQHGSHKYIEQLNHACTKVIPKTLNTLHGIADKIGDIASAIFNDLHAGIAEHIKKIHFFSILSVPKTLLNIKNSLKDLVSVKTKDRWAAGLGTLAECGSLSGSIASFASALYHNAVVGAKVMSWAGPLALVGAGLSIAGIALNVKKARETSKTVKVFQLECAVNKPLENYTVEDFRAGRHFINDEIKKNPKFISVMLGTKSRLDERLAEIEAEASRKMTSSVVKEQLEGKRMLKETMTILKDRMVFKKRSHVWSAVAGVVNTVALALLFTPLAPASAVLVGMTATGDILKAGYDYRAKKQFEKSLGL